jgi:hypothetical protein
MGDQTDRIDLISDDRIIELHEKYRQRLSMFKGYGLQSLSQITYA